jgi:hypothetical protein
MNDVIPFKKPESLIYVCACGCATFELWNDLTATCSFCRKNPSEEVGGWTEAGHVWAGDEYTRDVVGNTLPSFARRVVMKHAEAENAVAVLVVKDTGSSHFWGDVSTLKQLEWLERKISAMTADLRTRLEAQRP